MTNTSELAGVTSLPIPKSWTHVFHRLRIGSHEFMAVMGQSGPMIARDDMLYQAHLGEVTRVAELDEPEANMRGWCVCKYSPREPQLCVSDLSGSERAAFLSVFGLERAVAWLAPLHFENDILASPALSSLPAWCDAHPTLAARCKETYLPWRSMVLADKASR